MTEKQPYTLGWQVRSRLDPPPAHGSAIGARSRIFASKATADDFLLLYRREHPDEESWVSEVNGYERRRG